MLCAPLPAISAPSLRTARSARILHTRTKGTGYGVPALAGQTRCCHGFPNVSSRLQRITPSRLKPELHTLRQAHVRYRTVRYLVP